MEVNGAHIRCPKCDWEPEDADLWMCSICKTKWNTFKTRGTCPGCGKAYFETTCLTSRGGCGDWSLHKDWYQKDVVTIPKSNRNIFKFWQKKSEPPITENDKEWIEHSLLVLAEMFTPEFFRSLVTITPDKHYFDRNFTGTEEDVHFILETVASIMNIKPWEIQLMFFSEQPTRFSEGVSATPPEKLKGRWKSSDGELVDKGFGHKEIWIELGQMNDPISLIATISTELAKYKLMDEYAVKDDINILSDLTSIIFGFGIFKGNSYFKFAQWTGTTHQGWQMQKRGGLPEPIIAYVMAWLAHYRREDISWQHYLNKTMKNYFEKSYKYIKQNKDDMKWHLDV
jgi:hypothetical protein